MLELKANPGAAGIRLRKFLDAETLKDWFETDLQHLTVKQLISTLMSTKQPVMHPEVDIPGVSSADWSPTELKILSNVSVHGMDIEAYNNGVRGEPKAWRDFPKPQHEHIIFASGAVLTSSSVPGQSYDTAELLTDGHLNTDALFHHYEEKFMPLLLGLNKAAAEKGERVVINIPDFGRTDYANPYEQQIQREFPKVLRKLIETYANNLTNIHTINYFPTQGIGIDENDKDVHIDAGEGRSLHFQVETTKQGLLEFPTYLTQEQIKQQNLVVTTLVAGEPAAWPGNDIWANQYNTDESIGFASGNALSTMLAAKTLVISKPNPEYQVKYNLETGCEQFCKQENGKDVFVSHQEMIDLLGIKFVAHSYNILTIDYKDKPKLTPTPIKTAREIYGSWHKDSTSEDVDETKASTPKRSF